MEAAPVIHLKPAASELLLAHCFALDGVSSRGGPAAAVRLEELLGSELARRLVAALSPAR